MQFLDLTLGHVADNLALDESLLMAAENDESGEVLRVWELSKPAVVLGAASILREDVDVAVCVNDDVPIGRRSSGGGTVLLGSGCLLYSVVLAYESAPQLRHVGPSYCYVFERIISALEVPGLSCAGISDLAISSRKVSGNSQQRKRDHLLHHGTLLYAFDPAKVGRYLRMPSRQPDYRQQKTHAEFMTNLPLAKQEIVARLRHAFAAEQKLEKCPMRSAQQLLASKYSLADWTNRR